MWDVIGEGLDAFSRHLASVGISPAPWVPQAVLLGLVAGSIWMVARVKPDQRTRFHWLPVIPLAAIGVVILATWLEAALDPLQDHLDGQVRTGFPGVIQVELRDVAGSTMRRATSFVDTETGRFSVRYDGAFMERPHTLLLTAEGCDSVRVRVHRSDLRSGQVKQVTYACRS